MKKTICKFLYKLGLILVVVFGMALFGVYRELFSFDLIKIHYAALLFGISILLLIPEYYFSSKEYEEQYGEFNPRLASYWVVSLIMGITCIILSFIVR